MRNFYIDGYTLRVYLCDVCVQPRWVIPSYLWKASALQRKTSARLCWAGVLPGPLCLGTMVESSAHGLTCAFYTAGAPLPCVTACVYAHPVC